MSAAPALMSVEVEIFDDAQALARRAAEWLTAIARGAGIFSVVLSGGSTPKPLYELLARPPYRNQFPWRTTHWFWGDERMVPPDDPQSNYRMAREAMFKHVSALPYNIHPIPTENVTPEEGAAQYGATLKAFYGGDEFEGERALFDATLLGLGEDGHTASLFPESQVLKEDELWAAGVTDAKVGPRITLTYPALAQSQNVAFLVAGKEKRAILKGFLARDESLPAVHVRALGSLRLFADREAAS